MKTLSVAMWGEFFGTFLLVFFGCGAVATAVTAPGADMGLFSVAMVWGLGIATAIYITAPLSGAHLNVAVTLSLMVWGEFPKNRVLPYIISQTVGAFAAAAVLFVIFQGAIEAHEKKFDIVRGEIGSEASAMIFGEYFPNPGGKPLTAESRQIMSHGAAFIAELVGTALLLLVIYATTDERNKARPQVLTPLTIGLTVTLLISLLGPLTMACFNPARDFGPRLFSALVGWNTIPFTVNGWGWLTVYIMAPILGGWLGGAIYRYGFRQAYAASNS